jgi:hypothetical protein
MNLLMLIYITNIRPFIGRFRNLLELFNDFAMINISLMMMTFTDWVLYPPTQYFFGTLMMIVTSLVITFNMSIVIWTSMKTFRLIYIKYKRRFNIWRLKRLPSNVNKIQLMLNMIAEETYMI